MVCRLIKMALGRKTLLKEQIDVFLSWTIRNSMASHSYRDYLDIFTNHTHKSDVQDLTLEDVDLFVKLVQDRRHGIHPQIEARKALMSFMRFYMARSKNGRQRLGKGRPPATDQIMRVGELKSKLGEKISYREIGILLNPEKPVDRGNVYKFWEKFLELTSKK